MSLEERLLLLLSRKPGAPDYVGTDATEEWNLENALSFLEGAFPGFTEGAAGKRILDFGCGLGWQVVALAKHGAQLAAGVEINPKWIEEARALARRLGVEDRVEFVERLEDRFRGRFDVVYSQSSFEHFGDPAAILSQMTAAARPGGQVLITFYGPWYSPYGAHMHFFTKVPWVNLLFSEKAVLGVRARFRRDGARRYEEIESGLNRMTVAKFDRIVSASGLKVESKNFRCVKRLNLLAKVPLARELFINQVSYAMRK